MSKIKLIKNASMLYLLNAAKIIFPLLTFPYLTRVLSVEGYAVMAYVKAVMAYMYIWVDFGFVLSATKNIVKAENSPKKINQIVSDTMLARILLGLAGAVILIILSCFIPLLRQNLLFTWLSYVTVFLSCFMVDFLFRGLERMHEVTIRFVLMKAISTALTFILVHSDSDLLLIPILDILSSVAALVLIYFQFGKYKVCLVIPSLKNAWAYLKESSQYFISNVATSAFGILNTVLIGIFLPEADVAIWAVSLQLIWSVQMCYDPIVDGVYPEMMRNREFSLIKKLLFIFMPLILIGCGICYFASPLIIHLAAGAKYTPAVSIFRLMIPVLLFAFPVMLLGWPALGAIGKVKENTLTTIIAACTQGFGLGILLLFGAFTLPFIAIVRDITEGVFLASRIFLVAKYRKHFD